MKKVIFWIGILLFVASCSTQKKVAKTKAKPVVKVAKKDSVEYKLETFDQNFETWYAMQNNPSTYRPLSYYEYWNRQYVSEWNAKAANPIRNPFFNSIIDYNTSVNYGFKLNHKLFYYFQYVEHVLKIPILPNGPHVVLN